MSDALLESLLGELKLTTLKKNYRSFANEATNSNQTMTDYLKALLQEECNHRVESRIKRLIGAAKFPVLKTLAEFEFKTIPSLNKQKVLELAEGYFIEEHTNICLVGQTGTGKTHLATSIAYEACKKKVPTLFFSAAKLVNEFIDARKHNTLTLFQRKLARAKLIVIDELGYIPFSKEGAEHLFQFFSDCYEQRSVIVTSNLEFSDWTKFMGDSTMTSALLDRFTHHCEILTLNGESYRFKQRKKQL
jgi:DNA replication protein DnaC